MPATATAYNPRGVEIRFDEASHTYETDLVNNFISSSGIIHNYFPQFDAVEVSNRIAHKRSTTPEQLRQDWEDHKNQACIFGTRCHENAEYHLTGRFSEMHQPQNDREFKTFTQTHHACEWVKANFQLIQCEAIMFSERFRIAGTADLLLWDPKTSELIIGDWKTNAKGIEREAYNNEAGYQPVTHLQNCNFDHYSLQLSIYEFLLRHEGYFPPETKYRRMLIHLSETEFTPIDLPDRQLEASQLILYHSNPPLSEYEDTPF